jgi:hypothetical protein
MEKGSTYGEGRQKYPLKYPPQALPRDGYATYTLYIKNKPVPKGLRTPYRDQFQPGENSATGRKLWQKLGDYPFGFSATLLTNEFPGFIINWFSVLALFPPTI